MAVVRRRQPPRQPARARRPGPTGKRQSLSDSTGSIRFDRAAGYYDRTRALPPELARRQTELLVVEIGDRRPVVEVGVGTGRIALPLVSEGVPVIGLDLSRPMMEQLRANAGDTAAALVEGDATRLPFTGGSVGGVLIVHVLHLVPSWQDVVAEVARVLRPGGRLLVSVGAGRSVREDAERAFWEALGRERDTPRVAAGLVDAVATGLGLTVDRLGVVRGPVEVDVGALVDGYEQRFYSSTWNLPDDEMRTGVDAVRRWALAAYGEDRPVVRAEWALPWRRYSRPAPG